MFPNDLEISRQTKVLEKWTTAFNLHVEQDMFRAVLFSCK